ncbi:hypothetical protein BDV25DRAFT_167670 [Aspergillus avenaceus]|uniref:Uncharacterized protein n=1 Tax=Aspergillus avenaceus TaxID=36643 RepID=A0A5N6TCT7_ASPAV|nr:hypothetical protein BDV25DRAFT_167670 [Aspergillus avenaceus]
MLGNSVILYSGSISSGPVEKRRQRQRLNLNISTSPTPIDRLCSKRTRGFDSAISYR